MVANLKKLRIRMGVSQQQIANIIGTSQQSINKYENRSIEPDIQTLAKLADFFGTTIDYLVGHSPSPKQTVEEEVEFTKEEISLLYDYRSLSKEEKASIRLILKNYLRNKNASNK